MLSEKEKEYYETIIKLLKDANKILRDFNEGR